MGIELKSTSFLIDQLITTSHRCWNAQDKIMDEELSDEERLKAAITAQTSNGKRNALMRAIDIRLGEGHLSPAEKTYMKKE